MIDQEHQRLLAYGKFRDLLSRQTRKMETLGGGSTKALPGGEDGKRGPQQVCAEEFGNLGKKLEAWWMLDP